MAPKEIKGIAWRMDDIGAASKQHEVYSQTKIGNFLFLKYMKPFRKWGIYPELTKDEWQRILDYCTKHRLKLTLGITAGWVERNASVIPFPEKYPDQAEMLKKAAQEGLVEIANHGYTHCVLKDNAFRPRLFSGNRMWHREFWDWVPLEIQEKQISEAQKILEMYFEVKVVTFIPPGNVFTKETLKIAKRYGLRYLSCQGIDSQSIQELVPIPEKSVIAFHDKELVEEGIDWFEKMHETAGVPSYFIREIGKQLEAMVSV